MYKYISIIICFFVLPTANAQTKAENTRPLTYDQKSPDFLQYRNRWNLKLGVGVGTTWRYKDNFLDVATLSVSAEPSYRLNNYVALGARAEYTFANSYLSGKYRIKANPIGSLSLTGDVIKLWNNAHAPFIGLGAGAYFLGNGERFVNNDPAHEVVADKQKLGTRFGVSPRIGLNVMAFSIAVEVHLIDEKTYHNRDYATLKIGYTL
ncbi:hypothetical protein [Dyadobacter psychrotolerans]|uniref:Outer membrane protein beta-barrel domain-containing protein n=1 Tax=Dyadobacter psychrotolerans TaxID=2541721 RepID=A0A4R5DCY8_9BACT|nr:hypothetical protein [Dyadobacter psychrotolerans]TDE08395.1 hypothetical protein E0F88_32575 [Dyadobacter psychrotolerans]